MSFDKLKSRTEREAEEITKIKKRIEKALARIEEIKAELASNTHADDGKAIKNHFSPRAALNLAEQQFLDSLEALKPGGRGIEYADFSNPNSWLEEVEEFLEQEEN